MGTATAVAGGGGGTRSLAGGRSGQLPQVWTRAQNYDLPSDDEKRRGKVAEKMWGPPERVPLIHWQGTCKQTGSQYVQRHYVQPGLLPSLA